MTAQANRRMAGLGRYVKVYIAATTRRSTSLQTGRMKDCFKLQGDTNKRVDWFFGRGLSVGCNLNWAVPQEWNGLLKAKCQKATPKNCCTAQ